MFSINHPENIYLWWSRGDGWGTAERSGWPPAGGAWRQEGECSSPVEDEASGLRVYKNSLCSSALQQKWWFHVRCPSETGTYVSIMLIYPTINKKKLPAAAHLKLIRMVFTNAGVNWKLLLFIKWLKVQVFPFVFSFPGGLCYIFSLCPCLKSSGAVSC